MVDGGALCWRRSKYVNHSKRREVFLERREGSKEKISSSATFKYSVTSTRTDHSFMVITCLFLKHCISEECSDQIMIWIMRQMCRKSRTQKSGLKIDYSALWFWCWYLSAFSFPLGHHERDYGTIQDLFVYANYHFIGKNPPPLPCLNSSKIWGQSKSAWCPSLLHCAVPYFAGIGS